MNSNKLFWPVVAVLGVWLTALTVAEVGEGAESPAERAARGSGPVVAYVHGDSLQRSLNLLKNLQANLRMLMDERDAQLQQDAAPLQDEAQELINYANSGQATDDELAIAESRVRAIESELRAMQMAAENDLLVAEQNMQAVIAEALRRHLAAHAEEEGIDVILNWGLSGEGVLYGTEPWDITDDVIARINDAHDLSPALTPSGASADDATPDDATPDGSNDAP